jgi:hypothetical protein
VDATLRGPDNAIEARYSRGSWLLGHGQHHALECEGPVYLRVTGSNGCREYLGPYDFIKAADGAIFTRDSCLGYYTTRPEAGASPEIWQEVALLSDAPPQ